MHACHHVNIPINGNVAFGELVIAAYYDEYETLAGLIMFYNEDIPRENEVVEIENYSFTIEKTARNRIETVKVRVL